MSYVSDKPNAPIGEGTTTLDMLLANHPWLRECLLPEYRDGTSRPWLIIMRGLPGSGKSTKAKEIQDQMMMTSLDQRGNYIASADTYWIRPDGLYDWNPRRLKEAHAWCFKQCVECMEHRDTHVILDNTNIKKRDYQPYLDLATKYNYRVDEVIVGKFDEESCKEYAARNVHGCGLDVISKKAKEFEP